MATRLYFARGLSANASGHSAAELSTVLPVGTLNDPANRFLDLILVKEDDPSQSSLTQTMNTLAQTAHQDTLYGRWISPAIVGVTTIDANTWSTGFWGDESNGAANAFLACSIYVVTTSDTVRGFIYDSDTALGNEFGASARSVVNLSGSQVTGVISTDKIVVEWWAHATQSMGSVYTVAIAHGANPGVSGTDITTTDGNIAWVETPQNDLFTPPAAVVPRYEGLNHAATAVLMGGLRRAWHRRPSGIFVPEYAI